MKKKIILTIVTALFFYIILVSNNVNELNYASAVVDGESCDDAQYFEDDMEPCFSFLYCYNSLGERCGTERCC